MIYNGANPYYQDINGETAFMKAAGKRKLDCVKVLLNIPKWYTEAFQESGNNLSNFLKSFPKCHHMNQQKAALFTLIACLKHYKNTKKIVIPKVIMHEIAKYFFTDMFFLQMLCYINKMVADIGFMFDIMYAE